MAKLRTYEIKYRPHIAYDFAEGESERCLVTSDKLYTATVREFNRELAKARLALNVFRENLDNPYGHAIAMSAVRFIESIKEVTKNA
ncbi:MULTISPECIES: hypothetical protein [unclassified Cytobacillus]|uniref:hypothetical protein n=1 Tax=unclassified Cytobacillus TaxID=2675268 RepID=UPI0020410785|nr:hypothetical protein [Cytobacillus sp. AMY 15.2]MCM3093833.1 hypothetical protein [Cytobacillus sp. AMY 15.2]